MCVRRIQMNRKCAKGVYTSWKKQPDGGVWIMHWFLWTFLCGEHRKTFKDYPSSEDLLKKTGKNERPHLPPVLTKRSNLKFEDFIQHVGDKYPSSSILHPTRHNVFQWKGKPIVYSDDDDCLGCFS